LSATWAARALIEINPLFHDRWFRKAAAGDFRGGFFIGATALRYLSAASLLALPRFALLERVRFAVTF
jgi:hypothetical protein